MHIAAERLRARLAWFSRSVQRAAPVVLWKSLLGGSALLYGLAQHASLVVAQEPAEVEESPIPPALTHYKGRLIAQTMHYTGAPWLMRDSRQREEDCETLLKVLDCQPGQVICDMGCGNGFYTLAMAERVGETGRILAVDIQPEMLSLLNERVKAANLANIEPILGTFVDPHLPAGELDRVLLVDVYHEFSHPVQMLAAIHKSLKPKGRLVLVEFRGEDESVPIKVEHKMSKKQIFKELLPNGFNLVEEFDELPWQHVMFFEPTPLDDKGHPKRGKRLPSARRKADATRE